MSRKNVRRAWIASAAAVGVAAVAVPVFNAFAQDSSAPKQDECAIEELDDGTGSTGTVSASGEYITGSREGEPTVWREGEPIDLPLGQLDDTAEVTGVNSSGVVIGNTAESGNEGWLYQDGQLTMLSAPEGYDSFRVNGINDEGQIIGETWSGDGEHPPDVALLWEGGEETAQELPLQDGFGGQVNDIDESGNIVGHQVDPDAEADSYIPWLWDAEGNDHELSGAPEGPHTLVSVDNEFTLSGSEGDGPQYYWDITADGPFEVEELHSASAIDVNGTLYGMVESDQPGFVVDGEVTELSTLGGSGEHEVSDVSADGSTIVGASSGDEDGTHPVVWTCA